MRETDTKKPIEFHNIHTHRQTVVASFPNVGIVTSRVQAKDIIHHLKYWGLFTTQVMCEPIRKFEFRVDTGPPKPNFYKIPQYYKFKSKVIKKLCDAIRKMI